MKFGRKKIIGSIVVIFVVGLISMYNIDRLFISRDKLKLNMEIINNECNNVFKDIENSEEKYLNLLKNEEDHFKIGMYSSALVQVSAITRDYDKMIMHGKNAIENYMKIDGGIYYAIEEQEYLAWSMYNIGKYSESFIATNRLLEMINSADKGMFTENEIKDKEGLIYSLFLRIYTKVGILDQAEIYYRKLSQIKVDCNIKFVISKLEYASKIQDFNLMDKYAREYYELVLEVDKESGNKLADTTLLTSALVNIKKGNYEQAFNEIERAKNAADNVDDNMTIGSSYTTYAEYYEAIGENKLASEYYKKAIDIFLENNVYNEVKEVLDRAIVFLRENNIDNNINKYYEIYYDTLQKLKEEKSINELLSTIVSLNNDLNDSRVELLQKQVDINKKSFMVAIIVIIIFIFMITRLHKVIKKQNATEKKMEGMLNTDYLTNVSTRSYGEKLLRKAIMKNNIISIAIIDIDNFKSINDTYGHTFGDEILKSVSKEIKISINKEDIIYRYGGEEFIIVFINKDKYKTKVLLDIIRKKVNEMEFDNEVSISFSGGIAEWDQTNIESVIKIADNLLYKAKAEGKNRIFN